MREIRQIKQPLSAFHPAILPTSFSPPELNFRFRLCPPVFAFLRVNFQGPALRSYLLDKEKT
ncbi:MAG: hypothetical protein C5B58_07280 [Acidobacteria bacterium]|nr:MAG: hypothetical protein C5B58_07280 [Acidobacteriota bacterium]